PGVTFAQLSGVDPALAALPPEIGEQIARDALYATYIDRQNGDVQAMRRDEAHEISEDFDYSALPGLSNELKEKLSRRRPTTLAQAGQIEGITPAALTLILATLRKTGRQRAAG
ncbi:MAG: tRNA uridine-5-carboxymethylaminomethyl(34) synthesis enzyme MnmG, partial [Paracoccaceae bacterium]|nr:tRNA uridine-5-carboxymethylaminomethyl(34) synthesis enzyme MnmG [Paracoccaceae bacterium]